jgi:membrane protease YdiL (CAAX protease family)
VVAQRLAGALLLSMPAVIFATYKPAIVESSRLVPTILFTVSLSAVAVIVNGLRKRSTLDRTMYPHIRSSGWSLSVIVLNTLSWMWYLLPYEFALRGTLLVDSLSVFDLLPAFLLNAVVYSLAHAPQGWRETLSAFPFGILLCFVSYITGNFWSAYIIHVFLAVSNDYFAIRSNPSMHFSTPSFHVLWHSIKKTLL